MWPLDCASPVHGHSTHQLKRNKTTFTHLTDRRLAARAVLSFLPIRPQPSRTKEWMSLFTAPFKMWFNFTLWITTGIAPWPEWNPLRLRQRGSQSDYCQHADRPQQRESTAITNEKETKAQDRPFLHHIKNCGSLTGRPKKSETASQNAAKSKNCKAVPQKIFSTKQRYNCDCKLARC